MLPSSQTEATDAPASTRRRRRRPRGRGVALAPTSTSAALALAALLLASPLSGPCAHAAGGLRGGGTDGEAPGRGEMRRRPFRSSLGDLDELAEAEAGTAASEGAADEADGGGPSAPDDGRGNPGRDLEHNEVVTIERFSAPLLAKSFPYQPKYHTDNLLSGAVASYLAGYLDSVFTDDHVVNLGLDCSRTTERVGGVDTTVLECEGEVLFGECDPTEGEVNRAVRDAFRGGALTDFLAGMYPEYEMLREKRAFEVEKEKRDRDRGRRGGDKRMKKAGGNNSGGRSGRSGGDKKKKKQNRSNDPSNRPQQKNEKMKPQSSSGSGGGRSGIGGESGMNVFGYDSSKQPKMDPMSNSGNGYAIKNGDIYVYIKGGN